MFTDKDGKKLKIGSVVAARKPGRINYTIKGAVVEFQEDYLRIYDYETGFRRTLLYTSIKRIRYKGKYE